MSAASSTVQLPDAPQSEKSNSNVCKSTVTTKKKNSNKSSAVGRGPAMQFSLVVFWGAVLITLIVVAHQGVVLYDSWNAQAREHALRSEFVSIPEVDKFHFVADELKLSRQMIDSGVFPTAFRRWWENTGLFALFTLDSVYMKVLFAVLLVVMVVVGLWMHYHFKANAYYIDRMVTASDQSADRIYRVMQMANSGKNTGQSSAAAAAAAVMIEETK
jgi:hypothetical protein